MRVFENKIDSVFKRYKVLLLLLLALQRPATCHCKATLFFLFESKYIWICNCKVIIHLQVAEIKECFQSSNVKKLSEIKVTTIDSFQVGSSLLHLLKL